MQGWQRAGRVRAGLDLVQERDIPFLRSFLLSDVCDDMQILDVGNLLVERCEFVKARCKETVRPDVRSDVSIKQWGLARRRVEIESTYSEIAHASPKPS